mgnify:CR=1 FL=1
MIYRPLITTLCLLALLGGGSAAHAQQIGAKMQPTLIEERIDPGETLTGEVTVTNQGDETQTYFLFSRDVESTDIEGKPRFAREVDEEGLSLASWVTLTEDSVTLAPGESDTVPYVIAAPESAPPGGHFGAIVLDRQADQLERSGAGVGFQVASLMNIQINGDIVEDLKITQFSTDKGLYQYPPVTFTTVVENTGTVLQRPVGILSITDMLGNQVGKVEVNPEGRGGAAPDGERRYERVWDPEEGFYLGRYDALLTLSFGQESKQSVTRQVSFWVVPVREVALALGALLLFILVVFGGAKLYVRQQLRAAGHRKQVAAPRSFGERLALVMIVVLVLTLLAVMGLFVFFS